MGKKYYWRSEIKVPFGYPVVVYGSFYAKSNKEDYTIEVVGSGRSVEMYEGTFPHWRKGSGAPGFSNTDEAKVIPQVLYLNWISYVDGYMYRLKETPLDTKKIESLFEEGYILPASPKFGYAKSKIPQKVKYNAIQVGLAPGGVVIIWISGKGRSIEIGRYQAEKENIRWLEKESPEVSPVYTTSWRQDVLKRTKPKDANAIVFPPPYGIWDRYRVRYPWKVELKTQDKQKYIRSVEYFFYNGEIEELFGERTWRENQIEKYHIPPNFQWNYLRMRGVPQEIGVSWYGEDDVRYMIWMNFDEKEVLDIFEKTFKNQQDEEGNLVIEVDEDKDDATILLVVGHLKNWIANAKIEIFRTYQDRIL